MKNSSALTILKVEGIGEQSDCQVFQDDQLLKSISIHDTQISENFIEFSKKGTLTLVVKNTSKSSSHKFCVSLNSEALPGEGIVWLPLYSNTSGEVLPSIPSMLPSTRALVSINTLSFLTPVPEMNESDYSMFEIENSLNKDPENEKKLRINYEKCKKALIIVNEKNKDLRIKFCDLQNRFEKAKEEVRSENIKENQESFAKLAVQVERYKLHCSNLQTINEENSKKIQNLQSLLHNETEKSQSLEKELQILVSESNDYMENMEKRVDNYEKLLKTKETELETLKATKQAFSGFGQLVLSNSHQSSLQLQLQDYKEKWQDSENSRKILQNKLESAAQYFSKELEELIKAPSDSLAHKLEESTKELKKYRQKCAELENLLDDKYLNIKLGPETDPIAQKTINELKEQLRVEKEINETLMEQARDKNAKEIENKLKGADEKFVEYLRNFSMEDKFSRVSDGIFAYNNKKVSVAIRNGLLVCRVGGGYMGIDQFLKSVGEEGLSHKRSQTMILNEKVPKEEISKKVSEKKFVGIKTGVLSKENIDEVKYTKVLASKTLTKSLTPSRDCLLKRVFK